MHARNVIAFLCGCGHQAFVTEAVPLGELLHEEAVIDLAPPTIGSVHFFQPFSTLLVKGLATPRLLEIWQRGKVQTGISVLGVLPPF